LGTLGVAIGTGIVAAKMNKRSSDTGTYYAVEFDWQKQKTERVTELKTFVTQHNLYAARMNGQQNLELPAVTEEVDVEF
jgi:hypothetical protein